MKTGIVFNVQRFSIHDGPGIRTTVFLKGCPLRCKWCHNPEGLSITPDIEFIASKCIGCGRCTVCPKDNHSFIKDGLHVFSRDDCLKCGECVEACVTEALLKAGKEYTVDEVMKKVMSDVMFYKESGGGMTLSGGEPFGQIDFAVELLRAAKENGLHTAVETCGYYSEETLMKALPYVDLFLFDYKVTGREEHKAATGVYPERILENLEVINREGKQMHLRCPIIPGINDNSTHFAAIAALAERLDCVVRVDLEPYHDLGVSKYSNIGKTAAYQNNAPAKDRMEEILEEVSSKTSKRVVIS